MQAKYYLIAAALGFCTSTALAGQIPSGIVSLIETPATTNVAFITVDGQYNGRPPCSSFFRQRFVIDTTIQGGRNALAVAFIAKTAGTPVFVNGMGYCRPELSTTDEVMDFIGLFR